VCSHQEYIDWASFALAVPYCNRQPVHATDQTRAPHDTYRSGRASGGRLVIKLFRLPSNDKRARVALIRDDQHAVGS
jgi:hypothetical protein